MKPTIYLGLGGTGNIAISHAKKLYEEEYGVGNIPPSVAFVTVDFQTDMDEDAGLSTNIKDNFIKIDIAANPKEFYRVRREQHGQYTWMFDGNTNNIDNRISKGAKAVRTTGRLYTEMALETVKNRIRAKIDEVKNIDYGADVTNGVNIHMEEALNWQGTVVYFELYSNKEIDPNEVVDNRTDCESQFNEEFCGEDDLDNLW